MISRTETMKDNLRETLKKGGLSPHIKASLKKKLKNIEDNEKIDKKW